MCKERRAEHHFERNQGHTRYGRPIPMVYSERYGAHPAAFFLPDLIRTDLGNDLQHQ